MTDYSGFVFYEVTTAGGILLNDKKFGTLCGNYIYIVSRKGTGDCMQYETSVPFTGPANIAIEAARLQLMANGFKLDQLTETELIATGKGMYSTKQNPIVGVSHIRITVSSDSIEIIAELGGVKSMQWFLYIFPPALVLLSIIFKFIRSSTWHGPRTALLAVLPWVVVSPLMARWIKNRTTRAVDTLAHNMTSTGKVS